MKIVRKDFKISEDQREIREKPTDQLSPEEIFEFIQDADSTMDWFDDINEFIFEMDENQAYTAGKAVARVVSSLIDGVENPDDFLKGLREEI